MGDDILSETAGLPLDDRFRILLHKKIMHKKGSAKRRMKKYYKDQYEKTGVIPKPLLLAAGGVFEGRRCSGRSPALDEEVERRFVEMVEASADLSDERFVFVSQKARTIGNYRCWLEEEFRRPVSIHALRRFAGKSGLKRLLEKPDFGEEPTPRHAFKAEPVFGLLQMDGCTASYIKIRDGTGRWRKPVFIEIFDTGSRYMFALDAFFGEGSRSALRLFSDFLLGVELPRRTIRFRPDGAGGFKNLKRVIKELNLRYSTPGGFFMEPDFARPARPKDKAHLESSHRALHNFEARVLKRYADRVAKYEQGFSFKNRKKRPTTVACVDVGIEQLRSDGFFEIYRAERNRSVHHFSEEGRTVSWIPEERLGEYLEGADTFLPDRKTVEGLAKYGYKKVDATVSKNRTIVYGKREYYVASGAENFGGLKGAPVSISCSESGKLFIFERKADGLFLGEALPRKPFRKPDETVAEENETEKIARFLRSKGMAVDLKELIERNEKGLTPETAARVHEANRKRYERYEAKIRLPREAKAKAVFDAFLLDCDRLLNRKHVAPYAARGQGSERNETKGELHKRQAQDIVS
jgi:hypothetical protein